MKLVLMLTDGQDAIWSVQKDVGPELMLRMEKENYDMGLLAAEDQLTSEAKTYREKLEKKQTPE